MTPIGPFVNLWCEKKHFIVSTVINNQIVCSIVPNGVQAKDGLICPGIKEAKQWLKDNGFSLCSEKNS